MKNEISHSFMWKCLNTFYPAVNLIQVLPQNGVGQSHDWMGITSMEWHDPSVYTCITLSIFPISLSYMFPFSTEDILQLFSFSNSTFSVRHPIPSIVLHTISQDILTFITSIINDSMASALMVVTENHSVFKVITGADPSWPLSLQHSLSSCAFMSLGICMSV